MNKFISMFGIKIRFHSSTLLLFALIVGVSLVLSLFVVSKDRSRQKELFARRRDESVVDLVDLFETSVRLVHRAGSAIRTFRLRNNVSRFANKQNQVDRQSTEPVTLADLLSHKILSDGLRELYPQINVD